MSSGWQLAERLHADRGAAAASVLVKLDMSVATTPGATALTRIPRSPSTAAKCFTAWRSRLWSLLRPQACRRRHGLESDETSTMPAALHIIGSSC